MRKFKTRQRHYQWLKQKSCHIIQFHSAHTRSYCDQGKKTFTHCWFVEANGFDGNGFDSKNMKKNVFFSFKAKHKKVETSFNRCLKMQYEFTCIHSMMNSFSLLVFLPPPPTKLAQLETHVECRLYMKCSDNTSGIG